MTRVRALSAFIILVCGVLVVGCPPRNATIEVTPEDVHLTIGEMAVLRAKISGETNEGPEWDSSDVSVAEVNNGGRVIGRGNGAAVITAKLPDGGAEDSCRVTVALPQGFNGDIPTDPAEAQPTLNTEASVSVCESVLRIPGVAARPYQWGVRRFHQLLMPEAGFTEDEGKAALPFFSFLYAAPLDPQTSKAFNAKVSVTVEAEKTYGGVDVMPVQRPAWDNTTDYDPATPAFTMDPKFYNSAASYPGKTHAVEELQFGNATLLRLKVYPVSYFPSARRLVLASRMRIRVEWPDAGPGSEPVLLGDFSGNGDIAEAPLAEWLVNGSIAHIIDDDDIMTELAPIDPEFVMDDQFHLLIVTRPELYAQAVDLGRWRQSQGWRVRLSSLPESSYPTPLSIRDHITALDVENTVELPHSGGTLRCMRALLIFGDSEHIPPWQGLNGSLANDPGPGDPPVSIMGTDLYYAAIRGGDDYPDVSMGRISVNDNEQAAQVIEKIKHYDTRPAGGYPTHAAVYGEFQDDITAQASLAGTAQFSEGGHDVIGAGTAFQSEVNANEFVRPEDEDRDDPFREVVSIPSNTRLELWGVWNEDDYSGPAEVGFRDGQAERPFIDTTERVRRFLASRGVTVRYGYGKSLGPQPQRFKTGAPLPPELLAYGWDANFEDVRDNWKQGLDGIILHRDHGYRGGWSTPGIGAGSLRPMDDPETAFYPFVLSINCQSGWFDNEVDENRTDSGQEDNRSTPFNTECFCEYVLRMEDGGAVAIYGASRNSQSGPNDLLVDGVMKSFYPDYMPGALLPVWGDFPHTLAGDACRYAQTYVALSRDTETKSLYYLQLYHLFGCPLTSVRLPAAP